MVGQMRAALGVTWVLLVSSLFPSFTVASPTKGARGLNPTKPVLGAAVFTILLGRTQHNLLRKNKIKGLVRVASRKCPTGMPVPRSTIPWALVGQPFTHIFSKWHRSCGCSAHVAEGEV